MCSQFSWRKLWVSNFHNLLSCCDMWTPDVGEVLLYVIVKVNFHVEFAHSMQNDGLKIRHLPRGFLKTNTYGLKNEGSWCRKKQMAKFLGNTCKLYLLFYHYFFVNEEETTGLATFGIIHSRAWKQVCDRAQWNRAKKNGAREKIAQICTTYTLSFLKRATFVCALLLSHMKDLQQQMYSMLWIITVLFHKLVSVFQN